MSNTIPPFLCNTPPPIDFDETNDNDDDYDVNDPEFGVFNDVTIDSVSPHKNKKITNENVELPLPMENTDFPLFLNKNSSSEVKADSKLNSKNIGDNESAQSSKEIFENDKCSIKLKNDSTEIIVENISNNTINSSKIELNHLKDEYETEDIINQIADNVENYLTIDSSIEQKNRDGSPQSLDFGTNHLSEDDCSIGEFQNTDTLKYDDNTSLPSLKFDPVGNLKDDIPVFEDDSIFKNQDPSNKSDTLEENTLVTSAFQSAETDDDNHNDEKQHSESGVKLNTEDTFKYKVFDDCVSNEDKINEKISNICDDNNDDTCDNEDDEFDAFETFTCDRNVQANTTNNTINVVTQQQFPEQQTFNSINDDNTFEADFSQFEAFNSECSNLNTKTINENNEEINNTYENDNNNLSKNANGSTDIDKKHNKEGSPEYGDNNDDDDFGEFSDFNHAKLTNETTNIISSSIDINDKLNSIINMMFPFENSESSIEIDKIHQRNDDLKKIEIDLNDIDSAKALDYQWCNSNVKHSFIKALGIDSRNILYGEKWNINVPRFAANLGFGHLEPLKPVKAEDCHPSTSKDSNMITKKSDLVPAVEFDWNSSGLVNPLDGVKEILHERKMGTIYASQSNIDYQSIIDDEQQQQQNEITIKNNKTSNNATTSISNINNDIINSQITNTFTNKDNYLIENNLNDVQHHRVNITNIVGMNDKNNSLDEIDVKQGKILQQTQQQKHEILTSYTLPLKETHIFTPENQNKNISTILNKDIDVKVNSNSDSNNLECTIDFDYKMAAAGIIINENVVKKEYRDIEYDPTKLKMNQSNDIYDENEDKKKLDTLPSFNAMCCNYQSDLWNMKQKFENNEHLTNSNGLLEFPICSTAVNIKNNFLIENQKPYLQSDSNNKTDDIILPSNISTKSNANYENVLEEKEIEDEFSDFQYASPLPTTVPSRSQENYANTATPNEQKIMHSDLKVTKQNEMILSPAVLLPKTIEIEKQNEPKIDWPEPGINPEELERLEKLFPQPNTSPQNRSLNLSSTSKTEVSDVVNDDDDWSDFISVQAPIENKPTPINTAQFDDEWSDFVYSTPALPSSSQQYIPSSSSSVACVSDSFSGFMNSTTLWQQQQMPNAGRTLSSSLISDQSMISNQFLQNIIVPTSQYYQGNNLNNNNKNYNTNINQRQQQPQQQNILNGFSTTTKSNDHQLPPNQNFAQVNRIFNNSGILLQQQHQQQQQQKSQPQYFNKNPFLHKNSNLSLIPDLSFVNPRNVITASNKLSHPKK